MQTSKPLHKKSAFLLKTYQILQNTSYEDIIAWHYDGIGFVINNIEKFTSSVLPVYFKHSNFASFIRQLNMYGFSKKRSVKSQNYYFHAKFQRNQRELIKQIQRKIQKKTQKNIPDPRHQQHPQQIRISSELSIQLEYKPQPTTPKPQQIQTSSQKQTQNKYQSLLNINNSLINLQFKSILQILHELKQLKYSNTNIEHSQNEQEIQSILTQYIQAHYHFYNLIEQRLGEKDNLLEWSRQTCRGVNQGQKNSMGKLQTEESLKDKRDGQSRSR